MKKRGISHIEIIFSFVIFVVAVGFALYFLSPGDSSRLVDTSLTYSFREISLNSSVEVDVFSVKINNGAIAADEVSGNIDSIALNIPGVNAAKKTRVETQDGIVLESFRSGDFVYVKSSLLDRWNSIGFVSVKFSEDFVEGNVPSITHKSNYYEISSSDLKEVISEKRLLELEQSYSNNYLGLKKEFNLPDRVNFGFALEFSGGEFIKAEKEIPSNLEVFSDIKRLEIVRENGDIVFADLTVKVW